jgi:hypothetical protein
LRGFSVAKVHAADRGQALGGLAQRDGGAVTRLHAVHEVEHVAGAAAAKAVPKPLGQVNTTARPLVVVKRAGHLGLLARAYDGEPVVDKHGAEVRACLQVVEVYAVSFGHVAPVR